MKIQSYLFRAISGWFEIFALEVDSSEYIQKKIQNKQGKFLFTS